MYKLFKNKKILITGITGFKGSWLLEIFNSLGAKTYGISDNYTTNPNLFSLVNKNKKNIATININDFNKLNNKINLIRPDFIFHLAAQSQVIESIKDPLYTFKTNILGTANLLESLKNIKKKCICIIITSDKCYLNENKNKFFKENDRLGGSDPYSASKASAELIINSYLKTFYKKNNFVRIGVARAGNVIGGGDWTPNRIIPDAIKSWSKNKKLLIRNPYSIRPWQHVLEPLNGYISFAKKLYENSKLHGEAFNFGPSNYKNYTVLDVIQELKKSWKDGKFKIVSSKKNIENNILKLNSNKSNQLLKWKTKLNFQETIHLTGSWYYTFYNSKTNINKITVDQINEYFKK